MKHALKRAAEIMSVFILLFALVSVNGVNADEKNDEAKAVSKDAPRIEFKEAVHDFGEVFQNAKPKHTFTFKNIGKSKLVIEKVKAG